MVRTQALIHHLGKIFENIAKDQSESLGEFSSAFEQGSPAAFQMNFAKGFCPFTTGQSKLFDSDIIPFLKEKVEVPKKLNMTRGIPMLEENAKILATRFPLVLDRILKTENRASDNFFYEEIKGEHTLMMQRGEHAFPVYGTHNK